MVPKFIERFHLTSRRRLFPFRKLSLPFLTVDANIDNQAFKVMLHKTIRSDDF